MTDLLGPGAFGAARTVTARPLYPPGNAAGDPDTWVKDCSGPSLRDGTENRAAAHNVLLAQLRNAIRATGVAPDNTDDFMLLRAARSQRMNWAGTFGGTANALTVTWTTANPAPVNVAERTGKPLRGLVQLANTGAATLDGFPLKRRGGQDVAPGDLSVGLLIDAVFDGTNYRLTSVVTSDYSQAGNQQIFTASGSFVVPASTLLIEGWGGGGAGGATGNGSGGGLVGNLGGGGGGGGYFFRRLNGLTLGSTIAVTIGAGGVPAIGPASGGTGGTTSFGAYASGAGGNGGGWGENTLVQVGTGGSATGGDINIAGGTGGFTGSNSATPTPSDAIRGYGRGGNTARAYGFVDLGVTGAGGRGYGTGGSGASGGSNLPGGTGAPGLLVVRW